MSPAAAASVEVAARAWGPSSSTSSERVSGPRLLLSTTSWPAATASRATVLPMFPLPMSPIVVTYAANSRSASAFPSGRRRELADRELCALRIAHQRRPGPRVLGGAEHGGAEPLGGRRAVVPIGHREPQRRQAVLVHHQPADDVGEPGRSGGLP